MLALAAMLLAGAQTWTLDAVGDVMLGRHIALRLANHRPADAFYGVREELFKADFVVGNLECALTSRPFAETKAYLLRGPVGLANQLKGFTVVSLDNNHAGDCGAKGIADTQAALAKAGVSGLTSGPVFVSHKGLRVGFVGICDLDGYKVESDEAIKRAVQGADVAIALVHWGTENSPKASDRQKALAQRLYGMGVKVILGSHPHVLQPIEKLGNDGLVAYSLGNFIFDVPFPKAFAPQRWSEILRITFDKHGVCSYKQISVWLKHGFPVLSQTHNAKAHSN